TGVVLRSANPRIVKIVNGVALPVRDGRTTITAVAGARKAIAEVTVTGRDSKTGWSFRNHVQSVLSKSGCNSGACHGAAAGKNGFKLSLSGYDPDSDFRAITRQARGRRIVPSDPGRSLLLLKPTATVPHKGGLRFQVGSPEYRVVSEWIAAGQQPPRNDDPRLTRLEILPQSSLLKPGSKQQLIVRAHFSDGHTEDATRWAKFTATNLSVARVDDRGRVTVTGSGEGAIVAWYLGRNVVASLTVPYRTKLPPGTFAKTPGGNLIDELVLKKLQRINIPPSPRCSDSAFIRRAFLDTIGVLPTVEETRRFLADRSPRKRERLVDQLLTRPEFVDYWTYKWSDLLLLSGKRLRPKALDAFSKWIRQQVQANTPWDRFVTDIVTAKGSTFSNGAANFYSLHQDPLDMAETVSLAFLGMSIGCAKCHDHPLQKWTNDQYYGMANMFARVRGKGWGGDFRNGDGNRVIFAATEGELIQPRTGKPQPPRPLDGKTVPFNAVGDRRVVLARWLTSPANPFFSRAIVNRIWANFLGVGIVEKVDDLRLTNPPSNEALMAALAGYLVQRKFDLKSLMRLILTSQTYQRSSRALPGNRTDRRFYSHYYPRRLKAEVLLDAVSQVTGSATTFKGYPQGTRALQLRDTNVASYFLNTFGRPDRIITCECERTNAPSMTQILHIVSGNTFNQKIAAKKNRISQLIRAKAAEAKVIEAVYLAALCRLPTPSERKRIRKVFAETALK
ncbi:MAG: DUF1553 domain-containing protein, partial [Planctomycetes bacterium]|nr:DUF1553 domain-containing protein [Planctomycetota bacterium]